MPGKKNYWQAVAVPVLLLVTWTGLPAQTLAQKTDETNNGQIDKAWDAEQEDTGRSFFYKEVVVSVSSSRERDVELSNRPPGTYLGFDYVRTYTASSPINDRLPGWLKLSAIDLHPRLVLDSEESGGTMDKLVVAPQDFWIRFNLAGVDRLTLRIGQFVLPYGVNPPLAPRQTFLLPLEDLDLGLKWDWGIGVKGPLRKHDWELAATVGAGEAWHSPRSSPSSGSSSYLVTGRVGAPTYWDFQYGLSFLVGDLPRIRGFRVVDDTVISRWRAGLDASYKFGTYLLAGAQLTYGQDDLPEGEESVAMAGGETANVLGYRAWTDWVVPMHNDLGLAAQFESVIRELSTSDSDDTAVVLELRYSFSTAITLKLDYRVELSSSEGEEENAVYLTLVCYGW